MNDPLRVMCVILVGTLLKSEENAANFGSFRKGAVKATKCAMGEKQKVGWAVSPDV